jgi:transposase
MRYVGIDMGKSAFFASFDSGKPRVFGNDRGGWRAFEKQLEDDGHRPAETTIGTEATGAYHVPFAAALTRSGWAVRVINPVIVKRHARTKLRGVKTDKADSVTVRLVAAMGEGYPFADTPGSLALKGLVRERGNLVALRAVLKQRLHAAAWSEAGGDEASASIRRIKAAVDREIGRLEARTADFDAGTNLLLQSIPGIGPASASALIASVGDIRRFSHPKKLAAFIGLDCTVFESGESIHRKSHISKRGDRNLRHLLFMAALVALRGIPRLRAFYDRRIEDGHHHYSALCAAERKLVHIIWAVWMRGTPFEHRSDEKSGDRTSPDQVIA